ncbi:MAG: starch phosphorylase [Cyclobacteriaceae bacterium]|jgi:starch phosphorylase
MSQYNSWYHPYKPAKKYSKKSAYFSMEFAVDQALKIYSGGLGFLAGSHMRSAFDLKQNMVGIGMLWKYGYYDQTRDEDQHLKPTFVEKTYSYLEYSGIEVEIKIMENAHVKVRAYVLKPEIFGTVPMYLLSTDVEGNDHLSKTITDHLYDANELTRISQSMVLGIGGAKVVEALGGSDIYHLNEGHGLPAFYYLKDKGVRRDQFVFTTHTPEKAGNEERDANFLNRIGFFGRSLNTEELAEQALPSGMLSYTLAALRHAKISNAVSQLHGVVSRNMWKEYDGISEIVAITNAQHQQYWQDPAILKSWEKGDVKAFAKRKRALKHELFHEVANQTGKLFEEGALTIVWARRFAGYKRADLLLHDLQRLEAILQNEKRPVQIIWAGKPYPKDGEAITTFNRLVDFTKYRHNCAVLIGYEMELSRLLKEGSDIWLNNPRVTREASGTSGMTAAMNGSVNLSTDDGWIPEFAKEGINCFVIPSVDHTLPVEVQDNHDADALYEILEKKVIPTYYDDPKKWNSMVFSSIEGVIPQFTSRRMAAEYYELMY